MRSLASFQRERWRVARRGMMSGSTVVARDTLHLWYERLCVGRLNCPWSQAVGEMPRLALFFCGQSCSGQVDGYHCNQAFLGIPGDGWHSANNAGWFINQRGRLPLKCGELGIDERRGVYTYSAPVPGLLGRTWSRDAGGGGWCDALPESEWRPSVDESAYARAYTV